MTASADDTRAVPRSESRSDRRKRPSARNGQYMIAPTAAGSTKQTLIDRLDRAGGIEVLRTYAERATLSPPVAVVRMSEENAATLHRSAGGALVIVMGLVLVSGQFARLPQLFNFL